MTRATRLFSYDFSLLVDRVQAGRIIQVWLLFVRYIECGPVGEHTSIQQASQLATLRLLLFARASLMLYLLK